MATPGPSTTRLGVNKPVHQEPPCGVQHSRVVGRPATVEAHHDLPALTRHPAPPRIVQRVRVADFGFIAPGEEATGVKRVLDAAAWTYVAAFITSLAYFLWHLLPLLTGGRQRD